MDIDLLKEYLDDGYVIAPFYEIEDIQYLDEIRAVELDDELIQDLFLNPNVYNSKVLEKGTLLVIKWNKPYRVTIDDLFNFIKDAKEVDELEPWLDLFSTHNKEGVALISPDFSEIRVEEFCSDYLFKNDAHIIYSVLREIKCNLEDKLNENLDILETFVKEVLIYRNDENYKLSDDTLYLLVSDIADIGYFEPMYISKKMSDFFIKNVNYLVSKNNAKAMALLGYQYYEGTNFFPYDPHKSLELLEKAYELTQDFDLTRPIGYMYYYGRTTNGVPNKEKAFQYFAIGHFAGKYYECTYKLADCYVKGYGTPICHKAAFNLVDNVYGESKKSYLNGRDGKFADVALRLASYFEKGLGTTKSLVDSYRLYLSARAAIHTRMSEIDYAGDKSVASGISTSIKRLELENPKQERIIKHGGYLLNIETFYELYREHDINISLYGEDYVEVRVKPNDTRYELFLDHNLGYAERVDELVFLFKVVNPLAVVSSVKEEQSIIALAIGNNAVYLDVRDNDLDKVDKVSFDITEIIYIPQTRDKINKDYLVISVNFPNSDKKYDYLCHLDNVEVGDKLYVYAKGDTKEVTVVETRYCYEDELPYPLSKMPKAFKNNKNN